MGQFIEMREVRDAFKCVRAALHVGRGAIAVTTREGEDSHLAVVDAATKHMDSLCSRCSYGFGLGERRREEVYAVQACVGQMGTLLGHAAAACKMFAAHVPVFDGEFLAAGKEGE